MDLSFNDLKKREVINVRDGKSLGCIVDLVLRFPEGSLQGIVVPQNKGNFFSRLFSKQTIFIPERQILKIGGDVIFVDLRCGDLCDSGAVNVGRRPPKPQGKNDFGFDGAQEFGVQGRRPRERRPNEGCPPLSPCPPNCPPLSPCPPNCPPPCPPNIQPRGEDFPPDKNIFDAVRGVDDYDDY